MLGAVFDPDFKIPVKNCPKHLTISVRGGIQGGPSAQVGGVRSGPREVQKQIEHDIPNLV
jgi:hypothetical protein